MTYEVPCLDVVLIVALEVDDGSVGPLLELLVTVEPQLGLLITIIARMMSSTTDDDDDDVHDET